jgi:penicillin-binding protein A
MFQRRIWWIGNFFMVALLLLSTRIIYWQLVRGNDLYYSVLDPNVTAGNEAPDWLSPGGLQNLPQPLVQRAVILLSQTTRGKVYDRSGQVLAQEQAGNGQDKFNRTYTDASLAPVIGYTSGIGIGITGLEQRYNGTLLGLNRVDAQMEQLVHQPIVGSDLQLSIDENVQQAAAQALGGRTGSVLVLDGSSGAVLAMVSSPHIDPNRVQEDGYLGSMAGEANSPLINRVTQGLYPPGSTFKTVTLIAGLDTGQIDPSTVFDFGKPLRDANGRSYYVYRVGGGVIPDPNHTEAQLSLPMAYAKSANAAFAKVGAEMNPDTFISYGQRFNFSPLPGKGIQLELPSSTSQLAQNLDDIRTNDLLRAATAIGQGELLTNPYTMGLVGLAIVNDGNLPVPYLVQRIHDPTGMDHNGPMVGQTIRGLMKPETAREVRSMMVTGVEQGYGSRAKVAGVTVGGKTGTAQLGGADAPHAWFLGYAQRGKQTVVIVVMVENGGEGSLVAAPIFAQIVTPALDAISRAPGEIK